MASNKFDRMIQSLDNADIALIRKAEEAGLTTFSQGVKALYSDYNATVAAWNAALNPAPAVEEVVTAEAPATFIEEIEIDEVNHETDEVETVTVYRVTVNGDVDARYFYDRADAEALLERSIAAGRLLI